jgi:hypothetical protein
MSRKNLDLYNIIILINSIHAVELFKTENIQPFSQLIDRFNFKFTFLVKPIVVITFEIDC